MAETNFISHHPKQTSSQPATYSKANPIVDTETLVQMVKAKDEKGFEILYDNYCGALYGILIKIVKRTDVADDLMQETFVKIWRQIESFDVSRGTIFTWMLNIARNQAIDYLRSASYKQEMLHLNDELTSLHKDCYATVTNHYSNTEFNDYKTKAHSLSPKYAEVIDMIFFFGYTFKQTGHILNIPVGTVKTRARKGLALLKNICSR